MKKNDAGRKQVEEALPITDVERSSSITEWSRDVVLHMGLMLYVTVVWSYLVCHASLATGLFPVIETCLYSAAAVLLFHVYRNNTVRFTVKIRDLQVLGAYLLSFVALNFTMLCESIASDETSHVFDTLLSNKVLAYCLANGIFERHTLLNTPVNDLAWWFSAFVICATAAAWLIGRKLNSTGRAWVINGYLFLLAGVVGLACEIFPRQLTPHPPMRLLPLFISQTTLGLTDFAYRVPGVVYMALVSFCTYRMVLRAAPAARLFAFLAGFSIYLIPIIFHISAAVEPNIWNFGVWLFCAYAVHVACEKKDFNYLLLAGVIVGIGGLVRNSLVMLWPLLGLMLVVTREFRQDFWKNAWRMCLPGLIAIPFLLMLRKAGNSVTYGVDPVANIMKSINTGAGWHAIVSTEGWGWVLFTLLGIVYVLIRSRSGARWFYLSFFPGYCLYFSIQEWLWGTGRYQTDYVAPVMALTIFLMAIEVRDKWRPALAAALLLLGSYSVYANYYSLHQDIHFQMWPSKRLTTEKYFPYKDALGFLQRQECGGNFVLMRGLPSEETTLLSLRGFTWREISRFTNNMAKVDAFIKSPQGGNGPAFIDLLASNNISYFMVQYGDKMEMQCRSMNYGNNLHSVFYYLGSYYKDHAPQNAPYTYMHSFYGTFEGAIDIYGRPPLRYGPYIEDK